MTHTFPRGETVVGLVMCRDRLVVATTTQVWMQDAEGDLRPLEIAPVAESGPAETQVFSPPDAGF